MKKLLAIVISMAMIVAMMPVGVFADGTANNVTVKDEKELRYALYNAPTNGTEVTIKLTDDITLEMLYAAENFGTEKISDNVVGDTFNRYKLGVHPTAEDPDHWNPLVTNQTAEERGIYGAYYHMSATDERIARLVIKENQKIILDLNGHTIKKAERATHGDWSNTCTDIIGNYGTLKVTDTSDSETKGTIKGIGYISCKGAVLHNYEGATMTVGAVNVDGNAAGMSEGTGQYVISNEGGTVTIDGTNVHDTATSASLLVNTAGTMTIAGNAILNHPATKTVNCKGGSVNLESATITSDNYAIYAAGGTVNVTGSITISSKGNLKTDKNEENVEGIITKAENVELPAPSGSIWTKAGDTEVLVNETSVAVVGGIGYEDISTAIAAASDGDTVTLLKDVTLNETLNINKAITIISENENHAITSNAASAVNVNVNDAKVTFSNITINAYKDDNNRAIALNEVSGLELNLEKCNLNVSQRGITCNGTSAKMNLNIIDSEISLVKSGGAAYNYDEEYNNNEKRGISLWEMNDSKVTVKNSTIQGFTYNINNSGKTKKDSMIVDIEKCTFKGRAAINDWTSGTTWNVKDSTILGLNNQPGTTESFGCIVFNTNAEKNTCNVNGCTFETYFNKTGEENSWAKEFMFVVRADGNEITVDKNANGESSYSILRGDKGGISEKNVVGNRNTSTIKVYGGTFSTDPSAYVAAGYYADKSGEAWTVKPVPYTPSTPADNVTNNPADKNTTADLTPAVKDNKAETTVDAKTADKIVDKAVANKSTEVIVDATGNNTVASSEVGIPEKTVKELAEKTDANLVIKTDNGKVDLDKTAVKALADQAGTDGTVKLVVETVKTDENICHVDLKLITSNGAVKDFRGGNVKVTINLTKELAAKELVCVYIDDNGIYTLVEGVLNADGTYTFTTGHFSEYAVMAKAEADKKIAEQLDTLINEVNLKVRTSKTAKKNIKAVVSGDITALTDAGYTVKYKFYRSEKKASKYVSKGEKTADTYINTAGKKGTKYYYKAKAMVYSGDTLVGQTVLKQCKYGVRTWSK